MGSAIELNWDNRLSSGKTNSINLVSLLLIACIVVPVQKLFFIVLNASVNKNVHK